MYTRHTELRRLHERDEYNLALKLNERDCWRLMEIIPHHINAQQSSNNGTLNWQQAIDAYGRKYRHEHFELMKNAFRASGGTRLVSQILLDEWKTSGRREERPTLGVLLQLLVGAECWMAADFLATELLQETKPERPLDGPAARFHFPISEICADVEDYVNDSNNYPDSEALAYSRNGFNSISNNNRDYRTKFMLDKHIDMDVKNSCDATNAAVSANNLNAHYLSTAEVLNGLEATVDANTTNNTQISQTATTNTSKSSETISTCNIPLISTLMRRESSHIGVAASSQSSVISEEISTDTLPGSSNSSKLAEEVYTFLSEAPIPNLSILSISPNAHGNLTEQSVDNNTNARITHEILPVLSELYINGEREHDHGDDDHKSNSSSSISNDDHVSNDGDQVNNAGLEGNDDDVDVDCQSVPNLSIFEHNSNNDSSLTSVTGTSGENSFELSSAHEEQVITSTPDSKNLPDMPVKNSMELETLETSDSELPSQDNIPCLSALRQ